MIQGLTLQRFCTRCMIQSNALLYKHDGWSRHGAICADPLVVCVLSAAGTAASTTQSGESRSEGWLASGSPAVIPYTPWAMWYEA